MKKAIKILSIICIVTSGCWLVYILWAELGDTRWTRWRISSTDLVAMAKFYAVLIPSLILGVIVVTQNYIIHYSEITELKHKNKVLKEKIELKELEEKLKGKE